MIWVNTELNEHDIKISQRVVILVQFKDLQWGETIPMLPV